MSDRPTPVSVHPVFRPPPPPRLGDPVVLSLAPRASFFSNLANDALTAIARPHTNISPDGRIVARTSLRTPACERQNSSYRHTFAIPPGRWTPVRVPWSAFEGHGPGPDVTPFVPSLRRLGVVSIGEARKVVLAVGKVGFYNVI